MRIAYQASKLNSTQELLGDFFNLAINHYHLSPNKAYKLLLISKYSKLIEKGNPSIIYGKSGYELFYDISKEINSSYQITKPKFLEKTETYWAGWIVGYLQWATARSFDNIFELLPLEKIISMYHPYHEMDERHFVEDVLEKYFLPKSNLFRIRKRNKLTQKELANRASVSVRTIQMIEQRHNDINQVKAINLFNISRELNCQMEDLLE